MFETELILYPPSVSKMAAFHQENFFFTFIMIPKSVYLLPKK